MVQTRSDTCLGHGLIVQRADGHCPPRQCAESGRPKSITAERCVYIARLSRILTHPAQALLLETQGMDDIWRVEQKNWNFIVEKAESSMRSWIVVADEEKRC